MTAIADLEDPRADQNSYRSEAILTHEGLLATKG